MNAVLWSKIANQLGKTTQAGCFNYRYGQAVQVPGSRWTSS